MEHLLRIDHLSAHNVKDIFDLTKKIKTKTKKGKKFRPLEGKTLAMIFDKPSTRTRVSFEVGMTQLGGSSIYLDSKSTQLGRGESIPDTAKVLSRYVDGVVIRTFSQKLVKEFAKHSSVPVINGLTDEFHPCQILSDIFTIEEKLGDIRKNAVVAYFGDGSNNVAASWINAAKLLGFRLKIACPFKYAPKEELYYYSWAQLGIKPDTLRRKSVALDAKYPILIDSDPFFVAKNADVVYTDTWTSMGQEDEEEKRLEIFKPYQVNTDLLKEAARNVLVMHCLPAHRGYEITNDVIDGLHSIVFDQAENRLHVQKAILTILMS